MNWFADDHWRFEGFTQPYAPAFDWSITTDRDALPKYRAMGVERVLLSQWGVNRYAYSKTAAGARARGHLRRPSARQPARGDRPPA